MRPIFLIRVTSSRCCTALRSFLYRCTCTVKNKKLVRVFVGRVPRLDSLVSREGVIFRHTFDSGGLFRAHSGNCLRSIIWQATSTAVYVVFGSCLWPSDTVTFEVLRGSNIYIFALPANTRPPPSPPPPTEPNPCLFFLPPVSDLPARPPPPSPPAPEPSPSPSEAMKEASTCFFFSFLLQHVAGDVGGVRRWLRGVYFVTCLSLLLLLRCVCVLCVVNVMFSLCC